MATMLPSVRILSADGLRLQYCRTIGADFHRAVVAIIPGERQLIGRHPRGIGSAVRYQACFVQKITYVHRKINKNCYHQSCTYWLQCTKSFVGWGFAPYPNEGANSAPLDPEAVFRGPTCKGRGEDGVERGVEGRRGSSFFCPRKKKEKSAICSQDATHTYFCRPTSQYATSIGL